jgi:hypothetical protein
MDPTSESAIGQILNPASMSEAQGEQPASEPVTLEQIVAPQGGPGPYTGPERRAQGYLVAEVLPDPALDRQAPEFGPPR